MRTLRIFGILVSLFLLFSACGQREAPSRAQQSAPAGPILTNFNCELSVKNAPSTMKPGSDDNKIQIRVTNKSSAKWPALLSGRSAVQAVNIAFRWWQGEDLVSEGGRVMLPADLGPGESTTVELAIVAPKIASTYTLRVEPVQEAVAWFSDVGGCKFESKVSVGP